MNMNVKMTCATVCAGLLLVSTQPAGARQEQAKIHKSCPVLTLPEAAAVLGNGTIFVSGLEATSGATRISLLCEFLQGANRTLSVQAVKTMGARDAWEVMRKLSNGTLEPGLGDYAYSSLDGTKAEIFIVKGPLQMELRIGGDGATAADLPKLKEAAKKAFAKL
jgi:hypothetical protein